MSVLLDTSVWSLALGRRSGRRTPAQTRIQQEWADLVREGRVVLIGPVRQEILSGISEPDHFERLRDRLRPFPDLELETMHYELAAELSNACRRSGVAAGPTDALIASVCHRSRVALFTTDADFARLRRFLAFDLHEAR